MRILISGVCGFVGSTIAKTLLESGKDHQVLGFDNFIRPGSESNRAELKQLGARLFHADLRAASDLEELPDADLVGFPIRIALGEKSLAKGEVEIKPRTGAVQFVKIDEAVAAVLKLIVA